MNLVPLTFSERFYLISLFKNLRSEISCDPHMVRFIYSQEPCWNTNSDKDGHCSVRLRIYAVAILFCYLILCEF